MGTPLASSHRNQPIVSSSILFYMSKEQEIPSKDGKQAQTVREPRSTTISFRVSKVQREHIGRLAEDCGMTLSDYVLARAYDYRPKMRLTPEQEEVRNELIKARSDYAKYTSMLNSLPQHERREMFRRQSWMVGALQRLGSTAEAITKIIDRFFSPNRIPESTREQEETEDGQ